MMRLNLLFTRQEIIEKYRIPPKLESEVLAVLRPISGSGEGAMYLESTVDQQMHSYFAACLRLQDGNAECLPVEDRCMTNKRDSSWASTVERQEPKPAAAAAILLVDEGTAAQMLGVSKRTLFDLNKRGIVRSKQIGKLKRYPIAHLRSFAEGEVS